jgi:dolichyl-diphosphooligosaccharide--protein glycosyltransferase
MKMVKKDQSLRSDESKIHSKQPKKPWKPNREVRPLEIADLSSKWEDSEITTNIRRMILHNKVKFLMEWLKENPEIAFMRSSDGRGPMWWAYESDNDKIVRILKKVGVSDKDTDRNGLTPLDLMKISRKL